MPAQNSRTRGSKQTKKKQKSNSSVRLGSLLLLIIIGLGASGALFLAFGMMTTSVVVATENIRGNTQITSSMVTTKNISKGALPNNYISGKYLGSVVGSYTDVGITSGNVFTTGNIATKKSRKAAAITEGYTRMKINPSNIPNGIQVDDRINLLIQASLSEYGKAVITYQNILVTDVRTGSSGEVSSLEIEVTPTQAQQIQYAAANGSLSVTLLPTGYEEENIDVTDESSISKFSSQNGSSKSKGADNSGYIIANDDDDKGGDADNGESDNDD